MCTSKYCIGNVKESGKAKARTKIQRECLELCERLPELTERQRRWCINEAFIDCGVYFEKQETVWCCRCGGEFKKKLSPLSVDLSLKVRCPHCGKFLSMEHGNARTNQGRGKVPVSHSGYVTFIQTIGTFTVLRTFYVVRDSQRYQTTRHTFNEVYQIWVADDGREVILTKRYNRSAYYFSWDFNSEWHIGKRNAHCSGYYMMDDVYSMSGNVFYKYTKVSAKLRRNGWPEDSGYTFLHHSVGIMRKLLTVPMAEELMKTGQTEVLMHWQRGRCNREYLAKWMHAVRICTRNGVRINEADIFFDYIDLLEHFGKDTHNAHYVCPGDLRRAHDRLVMKKQAEDMKRELEEQMEAIGKEEPKYMDFRGKWFGMCFVVGYIAVSVLSSVRAFLEEGMAMKHCVFTNRYYDSSRHPNSLILSARDRNDNRLETVEVNTETWEIVQSRGFRNGTTRFHDAIIKLVNDNMNLLKNVE